MSQLQQVRFDRRTTYLAPDEERYWRRFLLENDPMVKDYIESQAKYGNHHNREIKKQYVCPDCEGFCMFDKNDTIRCLSCHRQFPKTKSHTVKEHLRGGHFR